MNFSCLSDLDFDSLEILSSKLWKGFDPKTLKSNSVEITVLYYIKENDHAFEVVQLFGLFGKMLTMGQSKKVDWLSKWKAGGL